MCSLLWVFVVFARREGGERVWNSSWRFQQLFIQLVRHALDVEYRHRAMRGFWPVTIYRFWFVKIKVVPPESRTRFPKASYCLGYLWLENNMLLCGRVDIRWYPCLYFKCLYHHLTVDTGINLERANLLKKVTLSPESHMPVLKMWRTQKYHIEITELSSLKDLPNVITEFFK